MLAALMATCVRCGLRFTNVMQMGAHTRKCASTFTNNDDVVGDDAGDDAVVITTPATVVGDANDDVVGYATVVGAPVLSLQLLARREKKGWGNESLVTSNERPSSTSATLARDFREVCVFL